MALISVDSRTFHLFVAGFGLAALSMATPVAAADGALTASYQISMAGFSLAKSNLLIKVEGDRYAARVGYRTAGLVRIASAARGEAASMGMLKPDRPFPVAYNLSTNGDKPQRVDMALAGGAISTLAIEPVLKDMADRVPITPTNKKDVIDPLSAILMPVTVGEAGLTPEACNRTLPIFDGWTRYDVKLSYKSTDMISKAGYVGPVVVCAARWVPIAGHRPMRESTRFMAENKDLELALAPIGSTGLAVPIYISVKTMSGTVIVDADRFVISEDIEKHAAR